MKICIRLAQLLKIDEANMHGAITRIQRETGISRDKVSELLHNRATQLKLEHLNALCDYLVKSGLVDEDDLPGALFAREAEHFWPILAARRTIRICAGVRRDPAWKDQLLLMATDSELQAKLIYGITANVPRNARGRPRHPLVIDPRMVLSPGQAGEGDAKVRRHAAQVYKAFAKESGDRALICLGSVKSNAVIEHVMANSFRGARPFVSEDGVALPEDRSCPFMMLYRPKAPRPKSCCGGEQLSHGDAGRGPGIYHELPDGSWQYCPWHAELSDAAMVFYRLHKPNGRLEVVVGGFSVRGTRCLTDFLQRRARELGSPVYSDETVDIGAYILSFGFRGQGKKKKKSIDPLDYEQPQSTEVHRLSEAVIQRRLKPPRAARQAANGALAVE